MDYQTAILAACRTLTARGSLTLTTGYTYALSADDILSFRFEEGVQGGDMLLGGAVGWFLYDASVSSFFRFLGAKLREARRKKTRAGS